MISAALQHALSDHAVSVNSYPGDGVGDEAAHRPLSSFTFLVCSPFLPAAFPWLQNHPAVLPPWETKLTWTDAVPTWKRGKFCPGQEQLGWGHHLAL